MIAQQSQQQILESMVTLPRSALAFAGPNGKRAEMLRNSMDTRLCASLDYLFCSLSKASPATDLSIFFKNLDLLQVQLKSGLRIDPGTYAFHWQLRKSMRDNDPVSVSSLLSEHAEEFGVSANLSITHFLSLSHRPEKTWRLIRSTLEQEFNGTYSNAFDATEPDAVSASLMESHIQEALQFLKSHDHETLQELEQLVPEICLISSPSINAGTSFTVFGFLYITCLRKGHGLFNYIENLCHEAAHHYLFALLTLDRLFENDDKLYRSPLRTEPRPMSGIFHALFVLARTIRILGIARQLPQHKEEVNNMAVGYNQAKNPATFVEKFDDCVATVKQNAVLTELGKELLENCITLVKDFS